ncbi:histidine kinase [Streptomyces monashensis]|uniref:sensor histidine kinase n=1 Tax=Streptomyces monashensis TaxID=1678012 RepID=UPI0033F0DBBA
MTGRIRRWQQRHWGERSKVERVELYSVITWHCSIWFIVGCWVLLPLPAALTHRPVAVVLGSVLVLVSIAQCATANALMRTALDACLGRAELPPGAQRFPAALLVLGFAVLVTLVALDAAKPIPVRMAIGGLLMPFGLLYGLTVPVRTFLLRAALLTVLLTAVFGWADHSAVGLVATAVTTVFQALFTLLMGRCGAWTLSVMWEADRARETEARLAVAEERLRFGRDLHDVLGRNLSVISLKSELAVQLARRGRPEAVEQMIEVQRIAQESQREVRAVVRGYREADLGAELVGAQGVLTAAGIDCAVGDRTTGLPAEVQSALGWVVREATTNVLRHGDAGHCTLRLEMQEGRVVLTVENDGAAGTPDGGGGSGLAGLRERLAAVGGTLRAGRVGDDLFRLAAEVPLKQETREVSGVMS